MKKQLFLLPLFALFSILVFAQSGGISYKKYCNSRFGYCLDYPQNFAFPQPESDNGDGKAFLNQTGETVISVYGTTNTDENGDIVSLEKLYLKELNLRSGESITYKKLGTNFFVISGYSGGKIFYQKTVIKENAFAYVILTYQEKERVVFDKVAAQVYKSFQ